jgi:hypothetical protein
MVMRCMDNNRRDTIEGLVHPLDVANAIRDERSPSKHLRNW